MYFIRLEPLARFRKEFFTQTVAGGTGFLELLQQIQVINNERGNIQRLERQVEILRALSSQKPKSTIRKTGSTATQLDHSTRAG